MTLVMERATVYHPVLSVVYTKLLCSPELRTLFLLIYRSLPGNRVSAEF